jgi:hypothetical protein
MVAMGIVELTAALLGSELGERRGLFARFLGRIFSVLQKIPLEISFC